MIGGPDFGKVGKAHFAVRRTLSKCLLQKRHGIRLNAVAFLVQVGRIEPEMFVLNLEFAVSLRDASFSENYRLLASGQGLANDSPFLDRVLQHAISW